MAVVIFKAIEDCNSNCLYCKVVKKPRDEVMSLALLETVFMRIGDFLRERPDETLEFTWHGGEACLLGADYFRAARRYQEKHCAGMEKRISHLIQSNMTLLSQDLVDAFKALGINKIGSSFEPLPNIRGFGPERDSDAYNRLFFKGVELAERNNLTWGVIYVVHRRSLGKAKEILRYLVNLNPRSLPQLNKIYLYEEDEFGLDISPEEYADFLGELFPMFWANRKRWGGLQPISTLVNAMEREGGSVCDYSGKCTRKWLYIGPAGKASHCGKGGDYDLISYGNIRDRSIAEILADPLRAPLEARQESLPLGECKDCRFWGICHGGCPLDALATRGDILKASSHCAFIKRFMGEYVEPITGMTVNQRPHANEYERRKEVGIAR